jgi:hypothetical protein
LNDLKKVLKSNEIPVGVGFELRGVGFEVFRFVVVPADQAAEDEQRRKVLKWSGSRVWFQTCL